MKIVIVLFLFIYGIFIYLELKAKIKRRNAIRKKDEQLKTKLKNSEFIYYKEFERNWILYRNKKGGETGYKYYDGSGCYVITIYDEKVRDGNYENYSNIYIGQSINVCQRVHNHFTGKGKGDIYADIKYGKHAYVRITHCPKEKMNELEKDLIRIFASTSSYNKTKGGSKNRF